MIRADDQRNKREKAEKKKEIELGIVEQERDKFVELSISNTMVRKRIFFKNIFQHIFPLEL